MTVLIGPDGGLTTVSDVGGNTQPFPKPSVPLSQFGRGVPMIGLDGRVVSYGDLYRTQVWVAVTVNKLARQVARLPLKLYRAVDGPQGPQRERVRTGKLAQLLRTPWRGAAPTHLKQAMMLPPLVHGNGVLRKVRDRRTQEVVELIPIAWESLRVFGLETGFVEAWETTMPGQPKTIFPEDVVHIGWRDVSCPLGISPLQQLGTTLSIEDAAQRHQRATFLNGARPSAAVSTDAEFLSMELDERNAMLAVLRNDLDTLYAGPENSGRPVLLPPGLSWQAAQHTAVEAELINQRKLAREEVAAGYDIPPPLIGMLERSTFNNITELHRMLYVTVLGPWLNLLEETLLAQLIDPEPRFRGNVWVEFDLGEVLKGDLLQRSQALAIQIATGLLTIDEARAIENRTAFNLPATRVPLYPSNNLTPANVVAPVAPAQEDVQQAASAISGMSTPDVQRILASSGGSIVDAILEFVGSPPLVTNGNGNGSHHDDDD